LPKLTELPIEVRIEAFREAVRMKNDGLRAVEIFERLHSGHLPIRYDTVLSWVNGVRNPARKLNVIKLFDGNLVELIGLVIGDGSWRKVVKRGAYYSGRVTYGSTDLELAQRAGKLMALVMGRKNVYRPYWSETNQVFIVESQSKHLLEVLNSAMSTRRTLVWRFRIRFLKGIYDAEGCITVRRRNGHVYPRVFLTNSDVGLIRVVRRMLRSLGIETTLELNTRAGRQKVIRGRRTTTRQDVYNICIGRQQLVLKFAKLIGFRIIRKRALLREVQSKLGKAGR